MTVSDPPLPPSHHFKVCWRRSSSNGFARLSSQWARRLWKEAYEYNSFQEGQVWASSSPSTWWHAAYDSKGDEVDFLPLEIQRMDGSIGFVSYNGGTLPDDQDEDIIDLPEDLFSSSNSTIITDEILIVKVLPSIYNIDRVTLMPLTTQDWEFMELYAHCFEDGAMLRQWTVLFPNQILSLYLGGADTSSTRPYQSLKVSLCVIVDPDSTNVQRCFRWVSDTEVIVVPKPRNKSASSTTITSPPCRLLGTQDDWSAGMMNLASVMDISVLSVAPATMKVHPLTLEPFWEKSSSESLFGRKSCMAKVWKYSSQTGKIASVALVQIELCTDIEVNTVALHILSRYAIEATPLFDLIQFHMLSTDAVERASQYTHELYVEKELSISFEVLTIEKYEDVNSATNSKPWRYLEEDYCQNDWYQREKKILSRRVSNDIVLTCDSLWFSLSTNSLLRLCIQDADDSARSHTNLSRVTPLCLKLGDLLFLQVPIVGASHWIPPPNDQHLSTAFWKTHYCRQVIHNWIHPFLKQKYLVDAWIVQGDVGTGKTNSVHTVAAMARLKWAMPVLYLDCKRLQSTSDMFMNSILLELTEVFREALRFMPSIMILDDLDCLVIHDGSGSQDDHIHSLNEQSKLLANHLQTWLTLCMSKVIWVISCRSLDYIPPDILETFNCFETIQLPALTSMERGCIAASMFSHDYNEIACQIISPKCDGYRVKDLSIISSRMQRMANEDNISKEDIVEVIEDYVPLSRQGISDNSDSYDHDWNCVGGIFEAKERLKAIVLNPIKYKRIYDKSPISLPKGILLFGPPGCGKTYMVPALAKECNYNLITCRGPELLDRYIGASEANVRRLFERARSAAPSILFLDEFDALAPRRGSDHTGVTDRVVNQLLTYLDGVETFTSENVFMIAATSRPDKIDPALLRPGRLEQHIYIGYPESFEEWMDILTKMMKTRQIDLSLAEAIQSKSLVWTKDEVQRLSQFSPADIKAVLDTAQLHSIHEYLNNLKDEDEGNLPTIQEHHLRRATLETRPSLPSSDRAMHAAIYQDFGFSGLSQVREIRRQTKLKTSLR